MTLTHVNSAVIVLHDFVPYAISGGRKMARTGEIYTGTVLKSDGTCVGFESNDKSIYFGDPRRLARKPPIPNSGVFEMRYVWREVSPLEQLAMAAER